MKEGKLSEVAFKRSALPVVKRINEERDVKTYMKTAVVSGNEAGVATLAVSRAMNAVAAAGVVPAVVAITISVPKEFGEVPERFRNGAAPEASENAVKAVMAEVEDALRDKEIGIADVSVEVTASTCITVSVTAVGRPFGEASRRGQNIVMVGTTAQAGVGMLCINEKEKLLCRYTKDYLSGADRFLNDIYVGDEILGVYVAEDFLSHVKSVDDGGVFGALWELCDELGCGCEVDVNKIPIKQVTVEICEFFDINPYTCRGDGAFLYITEKAPEEVTDGVVIGRLTDSADRVVINKETRSFLTPVKEDSYFDR